MYWYYVSIGKIWWSFQILILKIFCDHSSREMVIFSSISGYSPDFDGIFSNKMAKWTTKSKNGVFLPVVHYWNDILTYYDVFWIFIFLTDNEIQSIFPIFSQYFLTKMAKSGPYIFIQSSCVYGIIILRDVICIWYTVTNDPSCGFNMAQFINDPPGGNKIGQE